MQHWGKLGGLRAGHPMPYMQQYTEQARINAHEVTTDGHLSPWSLGDTLSPHTAFIIPAHHVTVTI
jgi:hypothetical protein